MTVQLMWVVETGDTIKTFENKCDADAYALEAEGKQALLAAIYACFSYGGFYEKDFLESLPSSDELQKIVSYLQSLLPKADSV